jgi:hypothetical protein
MVYLDAIRNEYAGFAVLRHGTSQLHCFVTDRDQNAMALLHQREPTCPYFAWPWSSAPSLEPTTSISPTWSTSSFAGFRIGSRPRLMAMTATP